MRIPYHPGRKTALMVLLGAIFCGLLVAFAVTSKVAAYYPHADAARPIAAAKMWQQPNAAVTYAPPVQAAAGSLLFVLVLIAAAEIATPMHGCRPPPILLPPQNSASAERTPFALLHATREDTGLLCRSVRRFRSGAAVVSSPSEPTMKPAASVRRPGLGRLSLLCCTLIALWGCNRSGAATCRINEPHCAGGSFRFTRDTGKHAHRCRRIYPTRKSNFIPKARDYIRSINVEYWRPGEARPGAG